MLALTNRYDVLTAPSTAMRRRRSADRGRCLEGRRTRKRALTPPLGESVPRMTSSTGDVIHPARQAGQSSAVLLPGGRAKIPLSSNFSAARLSCICLHYVIGSSRRIIPNCRQIRFLLLGCQYRSHIVLTDPTNGSALSSSPIVVIKLLIIPGAYLRRYYRS